MSRSQTAGAYQPVTLTSKASSPEKLIRATRTGTPSRRVSRQAMNGNASLRHVEVGEHRADDVARAGPDDRERRPLLGDRGQPHLQVRPFGLQPFLHPVEDVRRAAGGGEHLEPVLGQAHHGAVVDDHAVDAAHHPVADHADLQGAHHVRVEHVEEPPASGPCTSILPSVEPSRMPTPVRTAAHSRSTAVSMSSPGCG